MTSMPVCGLALSASTDAIPTADGYQASDQSTTTRGRGRRRFVVLLAAAALLVFTTAAGAQRMIYPDVPEPQLEVAIAAIWNDRECVPPDEARKSIQQELDRLDYNDWAIDALPGTDAATCVSAGILAALHEVRLMPGHQHGHRAREGRDRGRPTGRVHGPG